MTAYSVARRGREIGIRVALGATSGNVLGLVMREGAALVAVGTVIGLAGAWAAAKVLSAMVSVVASATSASTSDPLLLVGAPVLLAGLALLACYLPARKSMSDRPVNGATAGIGGGAGFSLSIRAQLGLLLLMTPEPQATPRPSETSDTNIFLFFVDPERLTTILPKLPKSAC